MRVSKNKILQLCFLLAIGIINIQCYGDTSLSSSVKVNIAPINPPVNLSDFTVNAGTDNEKTITGPWFFFRFQIINNTSKPLYLVAIKFKATGVKDGDPVNFDIGSLGPSDFIDPNTGLPPVSFIASVAAGQTYESGAVFIGGLPKVTNGDEEGEVDTLFLNVEGRMEGFFADSSGFPENNFSRLFYFSTTFN